MSNSFSLDDLVQAVEAKYASVDIEMGNKTVRLRNLMRLGDKARSRIIELSDGMRNKDPDNTDTSDITAAIREVITLAADTNGKALADAIGEDLGLGMHIYEMYMKGTQAGEADNSPS